MYGIWIQDATITRLENKSWFFMFDKSVKKEIRFANGRNVTSEGKGDIAMVNKDGQKATITNVLYVTFMTVNLKSVCQLLAKVYSVKLAENQMKVFYGEEN